MGFFFFPLVLLDFKKGLCIYLFSPDMCRWSCRGQGKDTIYHLPGNDVRIY